MTKNKVEKILKEFEKTNLGLGHFYTTDENGEYSYSIENCLSNLIEQLRHINYEMERLKIKSV